MTKFLAILALSLVVFAGHARADSDALQIVLPGRALTLRLADLQAKLTPVTVMIEDPVYGKQMAFDGFALADVLRLAGFTEHGGGDEIVFTAKDGYAPNASFADLAKYHPVLAFREHGREGFPEVVQGKAKLSPAPYYLVWTEGKPVADLVPWPYQLVKIEVVNFRAKYPQLYPAKLAGKAAAGFVTFKAQCIRCHSVNLEGGDLGPELNSPQNVTEYWPRATLRKFVRDASSFRLRDKMPPFTALKDSEIDGVLDYLAFMKDYKIKSGAKP